MKHPIPSTRFSTRLSGSARETEGRVRNILQGQRRRPPVLLILLFLTVIALCGSLVACREGGSAPSEQPPTDSSVPDILEEPQPGEYLLAYPIQAGGRTLTLHLYVKAISDDHPEFRGVRQVAVTEGERLLQTLPVQEALDAEWSEPGGFGSEYTECVDEEHLISIVDLDSDGNQDFGLFGWITTGANLPYYYWMWDPAEEEFDYGFCLSNAEPTAEQTTGLPGTPRNLILSHTRESAGSYDTTRYYYASGLIPLYRTREEVSGGGTNLTNYIYLDGEWVQIPADGGPIPDDTLAQLAGRYGLAEYDFIDQAGLSTQFGQSDEGNTLALVRSAGGPHVGGLDNLILGMIDHSTWQPSSEFHIIGGDQGYFATWQAGSGALYLLCSNTYTNQGLESLAGLGFFCYDGVTLKQLTEPTETAADFWPRLFSGQTIPEGILDSSHEFWNDHKAVARDCGLDLYRLTDDWDAFPALPTGNQWTYVGYLPFA